MATIEVTLKKPMPYYGMSKKKGDKILVDTDQVPRLVKKEFIDDPNPKPKSKRNSNAGVK